MKRLITLSVLGLMTFGTVASAQERPFVRELPFPDLQNTAQEVVNLVVTKGTSVLYNLGQKDEGVSYVVRTFSDFGRIYEVKAQIYNDGRKGLEINFYLTNRDFIGKDTKDVVADELMWGRPKIHLEIHMWDDKVDGSVDIYQMFDKRRGSTWDGFTREERGLGSKAGVREYLYQNGKILRERRFWWDGWSAVSRLEEEDIQDGYREHLDDLRFLLTR